MPKTHQYKFKAEKFRNSRFTCSTASAPSRSSTTLRPRKRRSSASSVAGESLLVGKEEKKVRNASGSRVKPRSRKCNLKKVKKGSQLGKSLRPNTSVLHNAIVLAPFHTLKRCFQNKLVDLYSHEKLKKINRKMRLAEKQKMSFEYDIVELNRLDANIKKEGKRSKAPQKLRSPSYCQCDRTFKPDSKKSPNTLKKGKDSDILRPQISTFQGHRQTKRRKLNTPPFIPNILKSELSPRLDFCSPNTSHPSDTNLTGSRLSSRSNDSCSDAPSCRDERLTGSLAISTTSFDLCLDQFDRPYHDTSPTTTNANKTPRSLDTRGPDCLPKPNTNLSRHLIMHNGIKNSDGSIVDFMDREPQTQLIPSVESTHHLQPPPRRPSKTRPTTGKKSDTAATTTGYFLRSLTPGPQPLATDLRPSRGSSRKSRVLHIEVATQVERTSPEEEGGNDVLQDPASGCVDVQQTDSQPEPASEEESNCEKAVAECSPPRLVSPVETQLQDVEGELGQGLPEEPAAVDSFELVPDFQEQFQASSGLGRTQDEDSSFIFGPRNTASRLRESCNFPFGLSFVFSDEED